MTLSITALDTVLLNVVYSESHLRGALVFCYAGPHHTECHYDESHYAECQYDESHYAERRHA
jgi:hypothetical protein